ncbi:MAG: hypothetical protein K6G33_06950 [Ruminococcus sp.]|uniref:hypothetical protein n=1 Tax=Ruminococcus sp. TaxID=41978 RepID=UPI0025FAFF6B|nr:hypothetical protein [Ruminococcus sp.]MCR5600458.1 hypothetical protein [Ruminococcus sp.]
MENEVLRTVRGGYDKGAVISKLDSYNTLLLMIEQGALSDAAINAELAKIRASPIPKAKGGLILKGSGFSVEDTDKYIADLEKKISEKIML